MSDDHDREPIGFLATITGDESDYIGEGQAVAYDVPPDVSVSSNAWELDDDGPPRPLDWMNGAGVTFYPDDDRAQLWISTGDPRGAFVMDVRRLPDGRIILFPPDAGSMHEELIPHGHGYIITRTIPADDGEGGAA